MEFGRERDEVEILNKWSLVLRFPVYYHLLHIQCEEMSVRRTQNQATGAM